ncbi:hypothetical protein KCU78_g79, partial [Aureobasidium melanogenum]
MAQFLEALQTIVITRVRMSCSYNSQLRVVISITRSHFSQQKSPAVIHPFENCNTSIPNPEMTAATAILEPIHPSKLFGAQNVEVGEAETNNSLLVVSPYTSPPHLLDLARYSKASQLFAKALTLFKPVREDYATAEYKKSFNLAQVMETLKFLSREEGYTWKKTEFYVVSFRSKLSSDADPEKLFQLDAYSHQEAMASGGLLKYWYGVKDQNRRNLATYLGFWESRQHARNGGRGPWHAKARAAAAVWYESIVFRTESSIREVRSTIKVPGRRRSVLLSIVEHARNAGQHVSVAFDSQNVKIVNIAEQCQVLAMCCRSDKIDAAECARTFSLRKSAAITQPIFDSNNIKELHMQEHGLQIMHQPYETH